VYRRIEGEKVTADIFRPANDEVCPAVLMIHGGAWSSGDKWHLHDHARELAQEGYVAISINYRLAPLHKITEQIEDCRAALDWVGKSAEKYNIDPKRIAIWGYSAGAHLACMLATQPNPDSPPVMAVVAGGAPCDFQNIPEDSSVLSLVMGGSRKQLPQLYHDVSPLNFANPKCPPTLFFHGSKDLIVPTATSRRMHDALKSCGVETEYVTIEDKGHLTTFIDGTARRKAIEFLNKHLSSDH
jgi:acetyl esterase/lipase